MKKTLVIPGKTSAEIFQLKKVRYNAFAYGHGVIKDRRSKQRSRKSKYAQRMRYEEKNMFACR